MDDGPSGTPAVPALIELVGAGLVILGLALVWLPLALIAAGVALVLVASGMETRARIAKKNPEALVTAQDKRDMASFFEPPPDGT